MRLLLAGIVATLTVAGLATLKPDVLTSDEKTAAGAIQERRIRADVRFLAHDLLEGRGPATRGDRLAQAYVVSRYEAIGLEPGAPDGTWLASGGDGATGGSAASTGRLAGGSSFADRT